MQPPALRSPSPRLGRQRRPQHGAPRSSAPTRHVRLCSRLPPSLCGPCRRLRQPGARSRLRPRGGVGGRSARAVRLCRHRVCVGHRPGGSPARPVAGGVPGVPVRAGAWQLCPPLHRRRPACGCGRGRWWLGALGLRAGAGVPAGARALVIVIGLLRGLRLRVVGVPRAGAWARRAGSRVAPARHLASRRVGALARMPRPCGGLVGHAVETARRARLEGV